jgi:hypothetical protein
MEQRRELALRMRAEAMERQLATVARLRGVGALVGVVGALVALVLAPILAVAGPGNNQIAVVLGVVATGACVTALGAYLYVLCRPLPKELLASGAPTAAVVLEASMVGPMIQTTGFGVSGTLMRHRYRLEVRPKNAAAYQVEIRTFDGPILVALNQPPLTVYVDSRDRMRVCPDWSTLPQGA